MHKVEIEDGEKISEIDISIEADYLGFYVSYENFGYYKVKGKCNDTHITSRGYGFIKTDNLISENCYVRHTGKGDVYVNVSGRLKVSLEFTGNVYYRGNPSEIVIDRQLSSGRLIPLEEN